MKNHPLFLFSATALLTLFTASALRAQFFGNNLIVGSNSSGVTTNFTSGTNFYDNTAVGYDSSVSNNTLRVYNAGTLLTIGDPSDRFSRGGQVYVGFDSSSGNTLVISNGGTVSAIQSEIGAGVSTNNTALVTGAGSLWTSDSSLAVGAGGSGHSLVISNGGTVATGGAWVGANSANNTALVTGAGSLWTNSNFLALGLGGGNDNSSNSLVISNGGSVATLSVSVGSGPTSSNNTVLVTDGGTWTNSSIFTIGREGRGNSLVISNGGRIQNNAGVIGDFTNSLNNSVLVTGAASTWTNSGALTIAQRGSGTLTVVSGGSVASSGITIASSNTATGTLNLGRFGTNDTGGTIIAPTIAFGAGTGVINFNQSDAVTITSVISGAGTLNQLGSGTTILSASNTYTRGTVVSAGSLVGTTASLQGAITNNAAVTFNQSTVGTYSGAMSGSGSLSKTGIGRLSLSGSSSYNGATTVSAGELNLSGGSIANSAVTVASGASLSGYGSVGTIGGAGAINPGNSPGILTTPQVNPSGGTTFNFEMTGTAPTYNNASNSVNDLIQITGGTPFSQALAAGNGINIYFSGDALFTGSTAVQYQGGFFTDQSASFASSISSATYNYYSANASGTNSYNGVNYYTKAQ